MTQPVPGDPARTFTVRAEICGSTEVGPTRADNQDAIMIASAVGTASGTRLSWAGVIGAAGVPVAVIDGMGGYAGGAEAAALTATGLAGVTLDLDPEGWDAAFADLSRRIALAGQAWGTPRMGATAALLAITPGALVMVNVGDCRIYRVAGGHLGQISVDDRTDDPDSSAVTQALGGYAQIDAHTWRQEYRGGPERYILCSDGVWGTLDPAVLRDICTADRSPAQIVDAVTASIYAQQATDNCSIVVVDLTATPVDPGGRRSVAAAQGRGVDIQTIDNERRLDQ